MLTNPWNRPVPAPREREPDLLLGWEGSGLVDSTGLRPPKLSPGESRAVLYDGDAPLLTCASTGAGKGRGILIPNLLRYPGPAIVMDIKGELFQVTSRRRREMGQHVIALDPFHLVTERSDRLNPLDLLTLPARIATATRRCWRRSWRSATCMPKTRFGIRRRTAFWRV